MFYEVSKEIFQLFVTFKNLKNSENFLFSGDENYEKDKT
jgi:hypothetical protein